MFLRYSYKKEYTLQLWSFPYFVDDIVNDMINVIIVALIKTLLANV